MTSSVRSEVLRMFCRRSVKETNKTDMGGGKNGFFLIQEGKTGFSNTSPSAIETGKLKGPRGGVGGELVSFLAPFPASH